MMNFVDDLKRDLIVYVEGKKVLQDTSLLINLVPVQSNVEINSVRRFMLGRKRQKAALLHGKIDAYHREMSDLVPQGDTLQLNVCTVQGELLSACYRDALRRQLHATDSISEK